MCGRPQVLYRACLPRSDQSKLYYYVMQRKYDIATQQPTRDGKALARNTATTGEQNKDYIYIPALLYYHNNRYR